VLSTRTSLRCPATAHATTMFAAAVLSLAPSLPWTSTSTSLPWARWKRCKPATSRTATVLGEGRRWRDVRHGSGDDAALSEGTATGRL
jgi:hypothetical protein